MRKLKYLFGLMAFTLVLTGCDTTSSEKNSEDGSDQSEYTVTELFTLAGYSESAGWPTASIKALFTTEDVQESWVTANVPMYNLGSTTKKIYSKRFVEENELIVYKSLEIAVPSEDESIPATYAGQFKSAVWDVVYHSEDNYYAINTVDDDDKIEIRVLFLAASEALPAATYFTYTVREKEEFIGAPRPNEHARRSLISFSNNFKITEREQTKVVWDFQNFSFTVSQADSAITVGNIPNNSGVGYLANPLRVYEKQQLTMKVGTSEYIEQLIFHTVSYTDDDIVVDSLLAFPDALDDARVFKTELGLLYHFDTMLSDISFTLLSDARLSSVTAIISPR